MPIRYPAPLRVGDQIGVTAPSSGIGDAMRPRFDFCVQYLNAQGFDVVVGQCLDGHAITSASATERAEELMAMLTDPAIRAVVPPWGGAIGNDLLPYLDFDHLAAVPPTWLVGYSDISTLLTPLTLRTGMATLHAANLMETPIHTPAGLMSWLDVARSDPASLIEQRATTLFHSGPLIPYGQVPQATEWTLDRSTHWHTLRKHDAFQASGRLLGGCLEAMVNLPGTPFGDVTTFVERHAPEGLIVYLEVGETDAAMACRMLTHLRQAGWFEHCNAVLFGRPAGPEHEDFSYDDAVEHALGDLDLHVVLGVDIGHVPPQLTLVNGALATVCMESNQKTLVQVLS